MPLEIDPDWEYWQADPEIEEILYGYKSNHSKLDLLWDGRQVKSNSLGLRFGKGNPNSCKFKLAKEKYKQERVITHRECKTCKDYFLPDRNRTKYCSKECIPKNGRKRELLDRECLVCKVVFRPRYTKHVFCSLTCVGISQRGVVYNKDLLEITNYKEDECKNCGKKLEESKSNNKKDKKTFCNKRCGANYRGRKSRRNGKEIGR